MISLNILLVEDELTDRLIIERFIKRKNLPYDIFFAHSVATAKEALSQNEFDVVLVDYDLGDGTAFDFFDQIPLKTAIIFITGQGNEEIAVSALKAGACDYLCKDIEGQFLKFLPICIEKAYDRKHQEIELQNYRNNLAELVNQRTRALEEEVNRRKQAEHQLKLLAITFESHEGIVITDPAAQILRTNKAFTEMTGFTADEVLGKKMNILRSGRMNPYFYAQMWKRLLEHGKFNGEIWNRKKCGEIFPQWISITAIYNELGQIENYIAIMTDITEHKIEESKIKKMAFYDPLTELANRRLLIDRLDHEIAISKRNKTFGSVIFLDLDNFKPLNDNFGHHIGDEFLVQIGKRLRKTLREDDTASRLGGDEFVILLHAMDDSKEKAEHNARVVSEKIRKILIQPIEINGQTHTCSASIGFTIFPQQDMSGEKVIEIADQAMYISKKNGKNKVTSGGMACQNPSGSTSS